MDGVQDEDGFSNAYLLEIGRLAVVSSTVDHMIRSILLLADPSLTHVPRQGRKALRQALGTVLEARVQAGELTLEAGAELLAWVDVAFIYLRRRDAAIHALWTLDPQSGLVTGTHDSVVVPDLAAVEALVAAMRRLIAAPEMQELALVLHAAR